MKHIQLFDTTLRDGQQCPGAGMSHQHNLHYASLAAQVGIDVLEAGFPSASKEDFRIVNDIAKQYSQLNSAPKVAALAQLKEAQLTQTMESLAPLDPSHARIHLYLPVAPALMAASLGNYADNKSQIITDCQQLIRMAHQQGFEVEFSPEAYSQMAENFDFVSDLILAAVESGASIINCPDTIGSACYWQGDDYFVNHMTQHAELVKTQLPQHQVTWSVHCHNDFGMALDNSLRAVTQGPATQIEGCFNGVGERAGNVALEQCIMAIKTFGQNSDIAPIYTQANSQHIKAISDFVAQQMLPRQAHWPIAGDNVAKHSSGGHTNAILKNSHIYQPFAPDEVGQKISFAFGPLSGSNHAKKIIEDNGYLCLAEEKTAITQFIKNQYSNRRKGLTDEELMSAYFSYRQPIKSLEFSHQIKGQLVISSCLFGNDKQWTLEANEATYLAAVKQQLEQELGKFSIQSYHSESTTSGIDSPAKAEIIIQVSGQRHEGTATHQDIQLAAITALVNACNRWQIDNHYKQTQRPKTKEQQQ